MATLTSPGISVTVTDGGFYCGCETAYNESQTSKTTDSMWGDQPQSRYCITVDEWYEDCVRDPEAYGYTKEQALASLRSFHLEGSEAMTDQEIAESEERYERALARAERALYSENTFKGLPSLSELTSKMSSEMNHQHMATIMTNKPEKDSMRKMMNVAEGIDPINDMKFFADKVAISSPPSTYELQARIEKLEAQLVKMQEPEDELKGYDPMSMLDDFYWPVHKIEGLSEAREYRMTREGRKIEVSKNPITPLITEDFISRPASEMVGKGSKVQSLPGGEGVWSVSPQVKYESSMIMMINKKRQPQTEDDIVIYKTKRAPSRAMWYIPAGVERAEKEKAQSDYDRAMKVVS